MHRRRRCAEKRRRHIFAILTLNIRFRGEFLAVRRGLEFVDLGRDHPYLRDVVFRFVGEKNFYVAAIGEKGGIGVFGVLGLPG